MSTPKVVGIAGNMSTYDPKSMDWSTYKGRFTFYLNANSISDADLMRATLLTLIGDTGYQMLAYLHLPGQLTSVTYDTVITDLDAAFGRKVSKLASILRFQAVT